MKLDFKTQLMQNQGCVKNPPTDPKHNCKQSINNYGTNNHQRQASYY